MVFRNLTGSINKVPLTTYDKLISTYTDHVKNVPGVKSIVQMGSFTTPGLSDIDLIVIVDNVNPPHWDDISIRKLLRDEEGFEVIVHDVFVYPEYLSGYIDGLFYIDNKKILFGNPIGEKLPQYKIEELKLILTFEYTVNRLEVLVALTSLPMIKLRDALLFISTLRHTYRLLLNFDIITKEYCDQKIEEIEELRINSINDDDELIKEELNQWIIPSYKILFESVNLIGEKLGYKNAPKLKKWILNYKKLIVDFNNADEAVNFFVNKERFNKKYKGKIYVEALPSIIHNHIDRYKGFEFSSSSNFDGLGALELRFTLVKNHEEFIKRTGYPLAKSYIIIETGPPRVQDIIKKLYLKTLLLSQFR